MVTVNSRAKRGVMVIGITGGYGTGKTEVAKAFGKFGAKIIDLDKLAHKALNPESGCFKKIVNEFGRDILAGNRISRLLLANKVFGNKKNIVLLNSIIHPTVIKEMALLIKKFKKKYKFIFVEAPLLFEANIKDYFDYIVVVKTDKKIQIERAIIKSGLSKRDILKRISSQLPLEKKISQADFIIDNSGSIKETRKQAREILEQIIIKGS